MSPTLDRRRAITSLSALGLGGLATINSTHAQATPDAEEENAATIVVTATGRASAPATTAIGQIVFRSTAVPIPIEDGPATEPAVDAPVPEYGIVAQSDLDVVVAALVAQGVDPSAILSAASNSGTVTSYFGYGTGVVVFQLNGEEIKTLQFLLDVAAGAGSDVLLQNDPPGAMYLADECLDLRQDAFTDAVVRGREEASMIASALGVELGNLVKATKQMVSYGPAAYTATIGDSCDDLINLGSALRTYMPMFDPTLPNEFGVYATLELVFGTA
jgi:uncharacterized protein YggE